MGRDLSVSMPGRDATADAGISCRRLDGVAATGQVTSWAWLDMAAAITRRELGAARADGRLRSALLAGCSTPGLPGTHTRIFPGTPDQVRAVRRFARAAFAGHAALDETVLVASELASNAIRHSASGQHGGLFLVHLTEIGPGHIGLVVTDQGGPGMPQIRAATADDDSGRGLAVAAAVTSLLITVGSHATRSVLAVVPASYPDTPESS